MIPLVILISLLLAFAIIVALYIENHSPKVLEEKLTDDPKILFEEKSDDIEVL